ncbi:MAG: IS3 family transposase [Gammaproteobacteria bacterium]|jgi:putative transposase
MIDRTHPLPVTSQCQLLGLNRSSVYYQPSGVSGEDLRLMRLIDEIHLKRQFYGSRRIRDNLQDLGHPVNRKKVQINMVNTDSGNFGKVFTLNRNDCSRSAGIGVHVKPE